jgi:hypothetical protein
MDVKQGFEQWFLLQSDEHIDNLHADQSLHRKHCQQAVERNAGIFKGGDFCCAMQGRYDRRADKSQLRPELREGEYLDKLVEYNAGQIAPFASHLVQLNLGNHETSIQKHCETNLTERIAERLRMKNKSPVRVGTYAGWVGFRFTIHKTKQRTVWMYRHHGYGGGGPVTRGTIQTARMGLYLPDANICWTGHTHDSWLMPIQRQRISQAGVPFLDECMHVRGAGYKDEFSAGEGWHVERGGPPKPKGAVWLRFYVEPGDMGDAKVSYELTLAK